jgi:hypothetical protein
MTNVNEIMQEMIKSQSSVNPFAKKDAASTEAYAKAKAALNDEAQRNWRNPEWHREVADVISARLDWSFYFDNLFSSYIDTMNVGELDQVVEEEFDGVKAFWTARGGYIDESQMKTSRFSMGRDTIGFHVSEFDDKLRLNFANSMESMIALGYQAMDAQINKRMFDTFQAAVDVSSDYYVAASAGLTKDVLDNAITEVADELRPKNGVFPPITIMGRRAAVDKISNVATIGDGLFDPEGTAEVRARGRLGTYRGANIQVLPNYYDENRNSLLPANELWVFGGTVGKLVFYGGTVTKTWEENTVDYRHYRARRDVGFSVWHPEFARRIVITEESS